MIRLVWRNPRLLARSAPAGRLALAPAPPAPPARMDLAAAIERQLAGGHGLADAEFVALFAGSHPQPRSRARRPAR